MFKLFKDGLHIVKYRVLWLCLSAVLLLPGIAAMIYSMVNYPTHSPVKVGIDYTGGTIMQYGVQDDIKISQVATIRDALEKDGVTGTYIQR